MASAEVKESGALSRAVPVKSNPDQSIRSPLPAASGSPTAFTAALSCEIRMSTEEMPSTSAEAAPISAPVKTRPSSASKTAMAPSAPVSRKPVAEAASSAENGLASAMAAALPPVPAKRSIPLSDSAVSSPERSAPPEGSAIPLRPVTESDMVPSAIAALPKLSAIVPVTSVSAVVIVVSEIAVPAVAEKSIARPAPLSAFSVKDSAVTEPATPSTPSSEAEIPLPAAVTQVSLPARCSAMARSPDAARPAMPVASVSSPSTPAVPLSSRI